MPPNEHVKSDEIPSEFYRAHIVIVDDEPSNRALLRGVCEKIGIGMIDEAEDGEQALDLITRYRPDMILLDIRMPKMDGLELMTRLRGNPALSGLAILVQTGLQGEDDRVRCFQQGATDVVSRPFNLAELKARIRAHLRSSIASRVLFDFRHRIQAHIEITHSFLNAILPTAEQATRLASDYGLICSSVYRPHDEIGGDLWSMRALDAETLGVVLVDASAHGLAGAINALRVDCLLQEYAEDLNDPGTFITRLDAAMAKISFGQLFAGAIAMTVHGPSGLVRFAGSGIPSPLMRLGDTITTLKANGLPLGSGLARATTTTVSMDPGATIVLFSDGWLENDSNPSATLAEAPVHVPQLAAALAEAPVHVPQLAAALAGTEPCVDDLTLIALQRR